MWHVIGNSWGVGQDGVGGLGLGPQEHFRWKMVLMRRTMVTVNKNVKGEIQKHHLYSDTEILDWNTEASLRGCGTPNTKSPRACADITIGGSVIVLPTLPPPTIPPVTGKIFSYTLIIFLPYSQSKILISQSKITNNHHVKKYNSQSQQPPRSSRPQPLAILPPQVIFSPGFDSNLLLFQVPVKLVWLLGPGLGTAPWPPGSHQYHKTCPQNIPRISSPS